MYADIGTSVYYVPGILYGRFGARSAIFVLMTLAVFVLLCIKYAEVTWRYPEGGGVVNVASQALHPFVGLLGGLLIMVDYFLTASLSGLSGVIYLSVLAPGIGGRAVGLTVVALCGLGILNAVGIRQSAATTAVFAVAAGAGQLAVVAATAAYLGTSGIAASFHSLASGSPITPIALLEGYGAAFLAFSGLESIAQLAPSMREPRRVIARRAMTGVVLMVAITSPLLTLWSTTLLNANVDPNQFVSALGAHAAGEALAGYVAATGAILLVFASNTAIIGTYHVLIALTRMGFMPRVLERRNRWRLTPHWAILAAVAVPIAVVVITRGNVNLLGDLYAFGLLGTFVLTCLSLDIVRWREKRAWRPTTIAFFGVGVITTVLVLVAWLINIVSKTTATEFGAALTLIGLCVGLVTYRSRRRQRPAVFPVPFRPQRASESIAHALGSRPPAVEALIVLPHDPVAADAVIRAGVHAAAGQGAVFLYRGNRYPHQHHELLEVADPWLKDYIAQDSFARAEAAARNAIPRRRYVYVPGSLPREIVGQVWRTVHPRKTIVTVEDEDMLPPASIDRIRRHETDGAVVLEMITSRLDEGRGLS
ncbi:MAG TPA: APC family permease [Candidatus Dormibacteraeota bacterium]|nr:APC family permease [Candidatus Dormibacteraeota bacterium]